MKTTIKQHGDYWFFNGDYESCPECGNDDGDELDYGPVTKKDNKYTVELKCMLCGCYVVFEKTEKEIKDENREEE